MMNAHRSMILAMEGLAAHPTVAAVIGLGIAATVGLAFAIDRRAERSRA